MKSQQNRIELVTRPGANSPKLNTVSASQVKAFNWSEKLLLTSSTSNSSDPEDILVLGFRSTKFVVYSLMSDSVLAETECGGSHRSWCAQVCEGAKQNQKGMRHLTFILGGE